MNSQCKSNEATGFLKPTKRQRGKLAKRKLIESDGNHEEVETSENDQEVESCDTNPQKMKTKKLKGKWSTSKTVTKSKRQASSAVLKEIVDNVLASKESDHNRFNFSDEEEMDDPEDDNTACSKNQLLDRIRVLQEENKTLRADNARLRAIRAVNDDIPTVKNFTKSLLKDLQLIKNAVDVLHHETQRHQQKRQPLMDKPTHVATHEQANPKAAKILPTLCTPSDRPLVQAMNMDSIPAASTDESHIELPAPTSPIQVELQANNKEASSMQTNDKIDENKILIGSRQVDKHCVSRIDTVKGISKFTASLCAIIFTDDELRSSSLTGHSCNFKKGRETTKRQLAPDVVPHLIEFVLEKFPDGDRERNKKLIEQSIRTKCNNATIQFKKKDRCN